MITNTGSISAAFVFAAMAIFAVSIIALVIWVAVLSSRQRKLSDWMMEQSEMLNGHVEHPIDIRVVQSSPTPAYRYDELEMTSAQPVDHVSKQLAHQPTESFRAVNVEEDDQYDEDDNEYYEEDNKESGSFFDGYRDAPAQQPARSFGRATPTIPFGADKDVIEKRESYMEDAISADFEPDSIDFSRVAGYRRRTQ